MTHANIPAPEPRPFLHREKHNQKHTLASRRRYKVEHAQFIGYVNGSKIRFGPMNELQITITVPAEFVEYALPIRYMAGLPLSVDILKWYIAPNLTPLSSSQPPHPNDDTDNTDTDDNA